jgi:hypothetical protein
MPTVIVVCGGVAAADAPSLMFRVTTVIAVHLATLAAGLAVIHAAHDASADNSAVLPHPD